MSSYFRDNVFETSQTTGTGDFMLGGAVTGARTFATAFSASSSDKWCAYVIRNAVEDGSFETGFAPVNGTVLKRSAGYVAESSNSNALVNWGAGTKNVWCGPPALLSDRLNDNIECGTAGGTANAITLSPNVPVPELRTGMTLSFTASTPNTGATTINVSGLGAKNLFKSGPTGPVALVGGELQSGQSVKARYDGTQFVMTSPAADVGNYNSVTVASGSAVSLSTGTSTDVASISLDPGDYDVWGTVAFNTGGSPVLTGVTAWLSTTAHTLPTVPNGGAVISLPVTFATGTAPNLPVGHMRLNLAVTTTVYLSLNCSFSGGTLSGNGFIGWRRFL